METLDPAQQTSLVELISTITMVVATVGIAIFTFLVWRLSSRQHRFAYYADLNVVEKKAQFNRTTLRIRLEIILVNKSLEPAILHEWSILVRDGDFQQSITDGTLGPTTFMKIPRYVGGRLWAVEGRSPMGFCLEKTALQTLTNEASIHFTINYLGGGRSVDVLRGSVPIDMVD